MNSKFLVLILGIFLMIFLAGSVNAVVVLSDWETGTQQEEINFGESINFNIDIGTLNPPMTINITLLNGSGFLVFEDNIIIINSPCIDSEKGEPIQETTCFDEEYIIDQIIYQVPGDYEIFLTGYDSKGSFSPLSPLMLKVNPPENNPPEISITSPLEGQIFNTKNISVEFNVSDQENNLNYCEYTLNSSDKKLISCSQGANTLEIEANEGSNVLTIYATDTQEQIGSDNVSFFVDTTAPEITILGDNPVDVEVFSDYNDAGATAVDNIDGDITNSISITNNVDTSVLGTYYVEYSVTDSSGNQATAERIVNVVDTTNPEITLLGDNPQEIFLGESYVEQGATAQDNYDGDITDSISIDSSDVDTSDVGVYQVTYSVTDSSGNTAIVERTINVVEDSDEDNGSSGGIGVDIIFDGDKEDKEEIPAFVPHEKKIDFDDFNAGKKQIEKISFWKKAWFAILNAIREFFGLN